MEDSWWRKHHLLDSLWQMQVMVEAKMEMRKQCNSHGLLLSRLLAHRRSTLCLKLLAGSQNIASDRVIDCRLVARVFLGGSSCQNLGDMSMQWPFS
jgi:hypothetical protein